MQLSCNSILINIDIRELLVLYQLLADLVYLDTFHGDKDDILENDNYLVKLGDKKVTRVTRQKSFTISTNVTDVN